MPTFAEPVEAPRATKSSELVTLGQLDAHTKGNSVNPALEDGVTGVGVRAGVQSILVYWNGSDLVHGHGYYEVEISTDPDFEEIEQRAQTKATYALFANLSVSETYHARVRGVAADGSVSEWATSLDESPSQVGNDDISEVSASKITAGTITATIEMQSPVINGGQITGVTITGGTFRTASSGRRIQISQSLVDSIQFFNASNQVVGTVQQAGNNLQIVANGVVQVAGGGLTVNNATVLTANNHNHVTSGLLTTSNHSHSTSGTTGPSSASSTGSASPGTTANGDTLETGVGPGGVDHTHRMANHSHTVLSHSHSMTHTHSISL